MKTSLWLKPFLFTLLILIAPIVAYYVYSVESREAFLLERFHAHLANTAAQTEARFSSAFDVMRYNRGESSELGLTIDSCDPQRRRTQQEGSPPKESQQNEPKTIATATAGEGSLTLIRGGCKVSADTVTLVGRVDSERLFDDIVIVDEKQAVVFQRDPQNGRIASAQLLVKPVDTESLISDPFADMRVSYQGRTFLIFSQPLVVSDETSATGAAAPAGEAASSGAGAGSNDNATDTKQTGSSANEGAAASYPAVGSWRIVGLLEEDRFNSLKYRVSTSNLALVALMVLTALLGGPFLKLWYLGRFEPLTRFDILLMIGAGLCLVAMGTVTLLAWRTSTLASAYLDSRLKEVAVAVRDGIDVEFEAAVTALGTLEPLMLAAHAQRTPDASVATEECRMLAAPVADPAKTVSSAGGPVVTGDLLVQLEDLLVQSKDEMSKFRRLNMAYVMDEEGCQLVKWASAATWTTPGRFKDRSYFLRALPDARRPLDLYQLNGHPYFQDVIVSRTTGEREVAFSKPVPAAYVEGCREAIRASAARRAAEAAGETPPPAPPPAPCVSVLTAKFWALETVLPYGYGAMLVDADSQILLRAAGDESTELNLASEVDAGDQLRTLVRLMAAADPSPDAELPLLYADYRMTPHRFLVSPVGVGGQLALVAFYDRNLVLAAVLEAVGAAIVAWLLWASILVGVFLAFWIADDLAERTLRRWPVLVVGLVALVAFVSVVFDVPGELLWTAAGIPFLLLASLVLTREGRLRLSAQVRRLVLTTAIWAAVILAAALPMKVFYGEAELRTLGAMAQVATEEFARAEEAQEGFFNAWKHRVGLGEVDVAWDSDVVWSNQGLFAAEVTQDWPTPTEHIGPCDFDIVCLILQNVPDYTADVARVHAVYRAGMPNARIFEPVREAFFTRSGEDAVPRLHPVLRVGAWTAFLSLTAVAIWYLLVRTFGLRAENTVEVSPFTLPTSGEEAHYMVYGVPEARRKAYRKRLAEDTTSWIDLRTVPSGAQIDIPSSHVAVVLDEFDSRLNDIEVVRHRVELLERLLRDKPRLILLFVSTDPLNFVTATYDANKDGVLLSRFALALSRFKLAYRGTASRESTVPRAELPAALRGVATPILSAFGVKVHEPSEPRKDVNWRDALISHECRHPDLSDIKRDLRDEAVSKKWSKGQIIQQVHSRANAIYQRMWSQCTRVEKFTLIELARGNPMNPNNWDAARRLAVRGYVNVDPFYRIGSESLRQFVARMALVEDVKSWNAASPGAWNQIKVPLLVLFIGAIVFVGVTQPGLFNATVAFVAAGAASLPFLANALSARLQKAGGDK